MALQSKDRLAFALDVNNVDEAGAWIARLRNSVGVFKVGLELFSVAGPAAVELVHDAGCKCFLDLKLHDIPATMSKAVTAASKLGVSYLTVHAAAGPAALATCVEVAGDTRLLAVTVLTSLDNEELTAIGISTSPAETALNMVTMAKNAGIRGFVTSAHECAALREQVPAETVLVVPGIRPDGAPSDDQRRVATPQSAIESGADLLVVGRPIRNATDPVAAAEAIVDAIERTQR